MLIALRFRTPVVPMDEGMSVVYGDLVRRALVPYRDFQTFYGPGMPWTIAAADTLLGTSLWTERIVAALARLALIGAVAVFGSRWGRGVTIAAGLIAAVELEPLPIYAWAAVASASFSMWSLVAIARLRSRRGAIAGGLFTAAAVVFRPDYVAIAALPALVLLSRRARSDRTSYVGALLGGLIPLATLIAVATPAATLNNLVSDASVAARQRLLPFTDRPDDLGVLLVVISSAVWAIAHGARRLRSQRYEAAGELIAYGTLTLLLLPQVLGRFEPIHLAIASSIGSGLFVILAFTVLARTRSPSLLHRASFAAATVFFLVVVLGLSAYSPPSVVVARKDRWYLEDRIHGPQIAAIVAASEAVVQPGMRIFIGPADLTHAVYSDTILYFLYPDLVPATYYLEMEPGTANRPGSRLASDIASADVLILTTRWDSWREPNDSSRAGSSEPLAVVQRLFRVVATDGQYALYVRR